jgi:hypothetical protein
MDLKQAITHWNGKSARDIQEIYETYHCLENFPKSIVELYCLESHQRGATWLLKAWLSAGNSLVPKQRQIIYRALDELQHWESKLHILQCIPFMPIAESERESVEGFLRETLTDQNKMVRAWSYNGFYELSKQYSEYETETKLFFEMALRDEAPSVKARIRNIMKNGF